MLSNHPNYTTKTIKILSHQEILDVLHTISSIRNPTRRTRADLIISLALFSALRKNEIATLRKQDLFQGNNPRTWFVPTRPKKNNQMPALLNDLSRSSAIQLHRQEPQSPWALSRPYCKATLWNLWHIIQLRSWGFHAYRFHDLRHTSITLFYQQTRDILRTQLFARHKDLQTTQQYIHLAERPEMEADLNAITSAFQTSNILPFRIAK